MMAVDSSNPYHVLWEILVQSQDEDRPTLCSIVFMVDFEQVFTHIVY